MTKVSTVATPGSGTRCGYPRSSDCSWPQPSPGECALTCRWRDCSWDEQDYGYWYHDKQRIRPDLASCMVAIDRAHSGNGCLNVLRGSHLLGRVDHSREERGEMHADPAVRPDSTFSRHLVLCAGHRHD